MGAGIWPFGVCRARGVPATPSNGQPRLRQPVFRKLLVANRGEVALRIFAACRSLQVGTVAVYSDADATAPHVRAADEAVRLGPSPPRESYLRIDALIAAAQRTGAQAIHPGYGFLSENPAFATACDKAGITFVGPPPTAMAVLGDKVALRTLALELGVPVCAGSPGVVPNVDAAAAVGAEVGYPLMLKAAKGGGGLGMRLVRSPAELPGAFASATTQAQAAFGDGSLFVERYLQHPRHIEVQLLADSHGTVLALGERECSIQRRHQKILEEGPAPSLGATERAAVHQQAVRLAQAGGYVNAGTVEFLFEGGAFFLNEMNTRLQVEHPVTEMVTGIDIVGQQLRIAAGERLQLRPSDIVVRGHAIECRINAEDPLHDFRPAPGPVRRYVEPQGEGIRVDSGITAGWSVPAHYDSLVAKVIVVGADRPAAIARMRQALESLVIEGFPTTVEVHRALLQDPAFVRGELSTRFLEERPVLAAVQQALQLQRDASETDAAVLAAALAMGSAGGLGPLHHRHTMPRRLPVEVRRWS